MEPTQYYILSVIETPENEDFLCFAQEAEVNGVLPVTNNLKEALVSKEHLIEDEELIYIEKSKVDNLSFGTIQERKHVDNNRANRIKLGLKYKDGHLQRATGAGVKEDYVLLLECASPNDVTLSFLGKELVSSNDLRNADICELPINKESVYVNKEKVDRLVTLFPNGAKVLLNTDFNLNELGLVYQDRKLCEIEEEPKEETVYYYCIALKGTIPTNNSVRFYDENYALEWYVENAAVYTSPLRDTCDKYFVPASLVHKLSSHGVLPNTPANLKALGLEYRDDELCKIEEEPKASRKSNWLGIALKTILLYK